MKQIEKFSIGGYVFTLEIDAVAETEHYIKEMSAYYSNPEITDGIEERMAELLRERVPEGGVVSKSTILSIIDILGRPERIAQDEPDSAAPDKMQKPAKKLYRDKENARLAGVCSGLGVYFNTDTAIFRIAFVAFTLIGFLFPWDWRIHDVIWFMGPVLYIILWICMPAAKTAMQRWEMRGDDGSAESVRRNIESGAADVGNALKQVGNAPAWSTIGRILEVGIGLLMVVISVCGLVTGGLALFGLEWLDLTDAINEGYNELILQYPQAATILSSPWVIALGIAVYVLPFIGMLYGGILLLFQIKSPRWKPGMVIFVLWLIAIITLCAVIAATVISTTAV